jgi:hypothetical protein
VIFTQMDLLRAVLGGLAVFFAIFWGRQAARLKRERQPQFRAMRWALRTMVCLAAVWMSKGVDVVSISLTALAAIAFGAGWTAGAKPPKEEHLEKVMFPEE